MSAGNGIIENGDNNEMVNGDNNEAKEDTQVIEREFDVEVEKTRILRIVKRIQEQRNRACYQSILSFAQRENKILNMEVYKPIIDTLVEQNLLSNKFKDKSGESFKIVEVISERADPPVQRKDSKDGDDQTQPVEAIKTFDDEFYNTLTSIIQREVKNAVKSVKQDCASDININETSFVKNINENQYISDLIATQRKDIEFLRNEVLSKDKIIQMLLSDKENTNKYKNKINSEDNLTTVSDVNAQKISSEDFVSKSVKVNPNKRSIVILGDSLLKDVEPQKVRSGLNNNDKVYVKSFSGATTNHMKSYSIPSKEYKNDLVILHSGTNDLRSTKQPMDIAAEIIELATEMKTGDNEVMVSGIVPRRDKLNGKGLAVNKCLISLCSVNNFHFINNANINKETHLNNSGLHLNLKGTYTIGTNIVNAIKL